MKELTNQLAKQCSNSAYLLMKWLRSRRQSRELKAWENQGRPVPPPHIVKQRTLLEYRERYDLRILVETGTFKGNMVDAMKGSFDKIYSLELCRDLYLRAKKRFESEAHIEIIQGDSAQELMNVMSRIDRPALFWLDGHYSGGVTAKGDKETPINEELNHILSVPDRGHVIIIDDARCFGADPAYPSIEALGEFIQSRRTRMDIVVQDDSIRITPPQQSPSQGAEGKAAA